MSERQVQYANVEALSIIAKSVPVVHGPLDCGDDVARIARTGAVQHTQICQPHRRRDTCVQACRALPRAGNDSGNVGSVSVWIDPHVWPAGKIHCLNDVLKIRMHGNAAVDDSNTNARSGYRILLECG